MKRKQCFFFLRNDIMWKITIDVVKKQERKKNQMSEDIIILSSHCPLDRTAVTIFFPFVCWQIDLELR